MVFFEKKKKFLFLKEILKFTSIYSIIEKKYENKKIFDANSIEEAGENDLTFLNSSLYLDEIRFLKSRFIVTKERFKNFFPRNSFLLYSKDPQLDFYKILKIFYPQSDIDIDDLIIKNNKKKFSVGKNCLIDFRASIGCQTSIGSNSIVKKNVKIGKNCLIGSNVVIENSLIGDNVTIKSGTIIGQVGFGFKFEGKKKFKFPHIGRVVIENFVQIGSFCTIDRGSVSDTVIGEFSSLDNQIQIAHNVKIGSNCIIAAQCGIAGSTIIGNNVQIGGQSGISGHLRIGNNVKIGGKSGITSSLADGASVMGYPAVSLGEFAKMRNSYEKKRN